jgi:MFS family permease
MGGFSDRIGNRKALMLSFGLMAATIIWVMISGRSWMLYVFGITFGFSYGSLSPLVSPAVAEFFGLGSHGAIFAVTFLWGTIGEAIGPFAAGWIYDLTNSYQGAFLLCLAISVMGFFFGLKLGPIRQGPAE